MSEQRLQEIKDSIEFQLAVAKSVGITDETLIEEKELYGEVVRLGNVINELEKWLKEKIEIRCDDCFCINEVLDKLKELKEEK